MLQSYFSPAGRIGRQHFWLSYLAHFAIAAALATAFVQVEPFIGKDLAVPLAFIISGSLVWLTFCQLVKRLHDRDKSAWYALHVLHPPGMLWMFVECGILPGTPGTNAFGRVPSAAPAVDLPFGAATRPKPQIRSQSISRAAQASKPAQSGIAPVNATQFDFPERKPKIAPIFGWRRK